MASITPTTVKRGARLDGTLYDTFFLISILWLITGTFADAWAHNNIPRLETPWTPWHAILYSGLVVLVLAVFGSLFYNRRSAGSWIAAIPKGYELSILGVLLMIFDGAADMTWHILFGVEQNVDAIFSPTHLMGMLCIGLVAAGPYRAMYHHRKDPSTFKGYFLRATSVVLLLVSIVNSAQTASAYTTLWPTVAHVGDDTAQLLAVTSYLLQGILFTGITPYTIRRWQLPFGFFTFVLTMLSIPLSFMQGHYIVIPISFVAGLLVDTAYRFLKPTVTRPLQFRIFAAIAGAALYLVYNITLAFTGHVVWSVHMMVGSIAVVAIVCWFLSFLALPTPPIQEEI